MLLNRVAAFDPPAVPYAMKASSNRPNAGFRKRDERSVARWFAAVHEPLGRLLGTLGQRQECLSMTPGDGLLHSLRLTMGE